MSFDFSRVYDIMDPENFADLADTVARLKMYPYFDVANYILMCMMVKDDNHAGTTSGESLTNSNLMLVQLTVFGGVIEICCLSIMRKAREG